MSKMIDVIAVASSAAAAIFSWLAVRQVKKQSQENRHFWRSERHAEVYRAVVREPVIASKGLFFACVREAVTRSIEGATGISEDEKIRRFLKEFNAAFFAYRASLSELREMDVFDLSRFTSAVMEKTEELQDEVTDLFDAEKSVCGEEIDKPLARYSGWLANALAQSDPGISSDVYGRRHR